MRYVLSTYKREQKENAYRIYVTDSLQTAPQNKYVGYRWADLFNKRENNDGRSGDEIAAEVITKVGLSFKEYSNESNNEIICDSRNQDG